MSDLIKVYSVYLKKIIDNELKPSIEELRGLVNGLQTTTDELKINVEDQKKFQDILEEDLQVVRTFVDENGEIIEEVLYGTKPLNVVSIDISNAINDDGTNGNISIVIKDGKPDYTYKLYSSDGTLKEEITKSFLEHTFYNLPADTYYIIVEDSEEPKTTLTNTNLILKQVLFWSYLDLWYDYDDVSTGVIKDKSGKNNNGIMVNNTIVENNYFKFQGDGDYIQTSYNPDYSNSPLYTWSLWFFDDKPGTSTNETNIIIGNYQSRTTPFASVMILDNGTVGIGERNTSNNSFAKNINVNVCDGKWHHIVKVATSSQQQLFIDGVLIDTTGRPGGNIDSNQNFIIGGGHLLRYQTAKIRDIKIYQNYAFTPSQIQTLYNLG